MVFMLDDFIYVVRVVLETVADVQEAVDALHIEVLRLEEVGTVGVDTALLVATSADVLFVEQVVDREVDVERRAVFEIENLAH